ncbi:MAG: DoxX family protein [Chitinophagaceae bacterium]|nr:DoxX family protein [Chitinophagaceae bacterium]
MKAFLKISRLVVGVLFIFSGLIKANDPLGLSYKMQEFFEVWGWSALNHYTLILSIVMIAFEIIAGVAVLLGWKMNLFSWLLLLLIIFFTFLTGYALFSGKIRECGCFGDCIPLEASQSFMKDIALLVLILFIFPFRHTIKPLLNPAASITILLLATIFSLMFESHVLRHLPVVDCLPYKIGNNLLQKMKAPAGSVPDSTVILFTYEKNGKQSSFTAENFPADFDDAYKFVKREDKLVRKGTSTAAIRDFALQTSSGADTTFELLNESGYKLFLFEKDEYQTGSWEAMMNKILDKAAEKNIKGFLITNLEIGRNSSIEKKFSLLTPLRADGTAIKTAARYNPTLFLLNNGTVVNKWSAPDLDKAFTSISQLK